MSILEQIVTASKTATPLPIRTKSDGYTAYKIATVLNETLTSLGYASEIKTSQEVYQMAKKGLVDGVARTHLTDVRFEEEDVINFVARYLARVQKNAAK